MQRTALHQVSSVALLIQTSASVSNTIHILQEMSIVCYDCEGYVSMQYVQCDASLPSSPFRFPLWCVIQQARLPALSLPPSVLLPFPHLLFISSSPWA